MGKLADSASWRKCPKCGRKVIRLSWSGLQYQEKCKQMGYLHRQGGKRATLQDQRNFFPGTVTDRVVRDWLLNGHEHGAMPSMVLPIIEREESNIKNNGNVMKWKDLDDKNRVISDCIESVTNIEPLLEKYVIPFDYTPDYKFEVPLELPHPDGGFEQIILFGYMDIIVRDAKGRIAIWDVKHTRNEQYWRKTAGQIGFYDFAMWIQEGQHTAMGGLFQPLCKERMKPIPVDAAFTAQLSQRIAAYASDVWNDVNTPRADSTECYNCSFSHACVKYAPKIVNGQKRVSFSR